MKKVLLTKSALERLEHDLNELIVKRKIISEEIKKARAFGDLSENAEYHAAREAQSLNETEILKAKEIMESYELVDEHNDFAGVKMNSKVIVSCDGDDEEELFIVSKVESDPLENKISNESPIGAALLGKMIGNVIDVSTPNGSSTITIINIINE